MKTELFAAIDIGTNTFRLLIAKVLYNPKTNKYKIKEIYSERIITRLGQGISENGLIKKSAINRGLSALKKFHDVISHYNVYETSAIATSALRDAKNKDEFLSSAKEKIGLEIKIISGREEAKKTSAGMLIDITAPESVLMVDIGGGSTELIFARQRKPVLAHSLKLGVVYLADRYMKNDPPLKEDLNQMDDIISMKIMSKVRTFAKLLSKDTVLIGTAGTITTLAAMVQHLKKFDHSKVHNFKLGIKKIKNIFSVISTVTARERVKYHPFEPERLDIIVPGTFILLKLMETFGFKTVIVSNYGLREGILLDIYLARKKAALLGSKKHKHKTHKKKN